MSLRQRYQGGQGTQIDNEDVHRILFDHASNGITFLSTRPDPSAPLPSLRTLAIRRCAASVETWFFDQRHSSQRVINRKDAIARLPPHLNQALFDALLERMESKYRDRGTLPKSRKVGIDASRKRTRSELEDSDADFEDDSDGNMKTKNQHEMLFLKPEHLSKLFLHSVTHLAWPPSLSLRGYEGLALFGRPKAVESTLPVQKVSKVKKKTSRRSTVVEQVVRRDPVIWPIISHIQSITFRNQVSESFTDNVFVQLFPRLSGLREIDLRGSIHIGDKTVECFANYINEKARATDFSLTAVTPTGLRVLFERCPNLETIRLDYLRVLTDRAVNSIFSPPLPPLSFMHLTDLSLRRSEITATGLSQITNICFMTLQKLDISLTAVRDLKCLHVIYPLMSSDMMPSRTPSGLTMLDISGLQLSSQLALSNFLSRIPPTSSVQNSLRSLKMSQMGMSNGTMAALIPHLTRLHELENYSIGVETLSLRNDSVGSSTWSRLLRSNGFFKHLKKLDLRFQDGISSKVFLEVMEDMKDDSCILECLWLDGTKIDDEVLLVLTRLKKLKELRMAKTYITEIALDEAVTDLPNLHKLDLTGCRSIPIHRRRTFFEKLMLRD